MHQLQINVSPEILKEKVTFNSSMPSVATISTSGLIKGLLPGETKISASSPDGSVKDEFTLTITPKFVSVTNVAIQNKQESLVEGQTLSLNVQVEPSNATNKKVTFASSNTDYATVDDQGTITAITPTDGNEKVKITVTSASDNTKTDSFEFVITKKVTQVTSISVNILSQEIIPGDEVKYEVNVLPQEADDKSYNVSTSTSDILQIKENNQIFSLKSGQGKLKFTTNDQSKTCEVDVNVLDTSTYEQIKTLLDSSVTKESEKANGGTYKETEDEEQTTTSWTTYKDAIQIKETDGSTTTTSLVYREGNTIYTLKDCKSDNSYSDGVTLSEEEIGDGYWDLSEDDAKKHLTLPEIDYSTYGLCEKVKAILDDYLTYSKEEILKNVRIVIVPLESGKKVKVNSSAEYKKNYWDDGFSFMEVALEIAFGSDDTLLSFTSSVKEYGVSDYDQNNHQISDNANPSVTTTEGELTYEERLETDQNRISKKDYEVTSFEIDTSVFANNQIEKGTSKDIQIINENPTRHLKEEYTVTIENESIIAKGSYWNPLSITGKEEGTTNITVTSSHNVSRTFSLTVVTPEVKSISLSCPYTTLNVGESIEISANVYPSEANDLTYTITLGENDTNYSTLTSLEDGKYKLEGVAPGEVTLTATSNANHEITDSKTITIKEKPSVDSIKNALCESQYTATDSTLKFNLDGTGSLTLQGGGQYTFNWEIDSDYKITFTNVVTTKSPDKWYDFKGAAGSYTFEDASSVNLVIYDLDESSNTQMQFSR